MNENSYNLLQVYLFGGECMLVCAVKSLLYTLFLVFC
jgi:hypothetical protein